MLSSAPELYRGMNRAALDAAYDNVAHVGQVKRDACVAGWWERSDAARRSPTAQLNVHYGDASRQRLDLFPCGVSGAPTLVYIHGGYWQWNDKERDVFVGEGALSVDFNFVLVEYTLAPAARMEEIVADVRAALDWTITHATEFAADPTRVFVAGHSAGGHLTAMALADRRLAGGVAISGIFDLEPIRLCGLNDNLHLDRRSVQEYSPLRKLPLIAPPLIVAVGLAELPELIRQSAEYAAAWREAGLPGTYLPVPGCDHFSILEEFARPTGVILDALKKLVGEGRRS